MTPNDNGRRVLQKRAARGNATAQDALASLYHWEKADHRAVKWFRRAAEQGDYGNVVTESQNASFQLLALTLSGHHTHAHSTVPCWNSPDTPKLSPG